MKRIQVVAGVIYGDKNHYPNQILISRRPDYLHQGGLWEFPGGKIEHNEAPQQGLTRELEEELSIRVTHAEPLMKIHHDYADKKVSLDIWSVTAFEGEARGMEGQEIAWVPVDQLMNYNFPEANRAILEKVLG